MLQLLPKINSSSQLFLLSQLDSRSYEGQVFLQTHRCLSSNPRMNLKSQVACSWLNPNVQNNVNCVFNFMPYIQMMINLLVTWSCIFGEFLSCFLCFLSLLGLLPWRTLWFKTWWMIQSERSAWMLLDGLAIFLPSTLSVWSTWGFISSCVHVLGGWLQSHEPYTFE